MSEALLARALTTDQLSPDQGEDSVERLLHVKAALQVDDDGRPDPQIVGNGTPD